MMKHEFRASDVGIAVFVLLIASLLLIPLPTSLLDILIVINIAMSVLLLLVGLYMPSALALLSFPSLLLLTTLFRLGLNVASTRLILSQADAGEVIDAFGSFLISGEIVVGIIIFLIITVVNFMVVAKGAGRVSEVAARFALDALPGKQMTIDSEQRSGMISAEEAQRRREDLRKESQLYGSMDGAMKFVAGDALAGLFITATNILGGLYMGLSAGMSVGDAIATYSTLTIGDGLVSQIPALLVAICAGIVVTRVASGDSSTLGSDVSEQIFARPVALLVAGALMGSFALSPMLPTVPFLLVGSLLLLTGFAANGNRFSQLFPKRHRTVESNRTTRPLALPNNPRKSIEYGEHLLELRIDPDSFPSLKSTPFTDFEEYWAELSEQMKYSCGLELPGFSVRASRHYQPESIEVWFRGTSLLKKHQPAQSIFLEMPPAQASFLGFEPLHAEEHPWDGHRSAFVNDTRSAQELCRALQLPVLDAVRYGLLCAVYELLRRPEELFGVRIVFDWLSELERRRPGFVEASIDTDFFSPARLYELSCAMMRLGLAVQPFEEVIELASSYLSQADRALVKQGEFDLDDVLAFARQQRMRVILARERDSYGRLIYLRLAPQCEDQLRLLQRSALLGHDLMSGAVELRKAIAEGLRPLREAGVLNPVLVVEQDLLTRLQLLLRGERWHTSILGSEEISLARDAHQIGVCNLEG